MSIGDKVKGALITESSAYPARQVDDDLYDTVTDGLADAEATSGPRLRVRPPRENNGMDASISLYETVHDPREQVIGAGRFKFVRTNAHIHAYEMVYDEGKLQFFFKPATRVDANQFERQLRKNYPNAQIAQADKQFPTLDVGDHVSMARMRLKKPFYYPIKCKIAEEDFEVDPYGDITSDMVVEEDQTSTGERVLAEDCRVMVQTVFEPARDVWTKRRPYGLNVTEAAAHIKEGELTGNMLRGFEIRDPGSKRTRAAKIIDKLHGAKGYYLTIRVTAISPHKEIAERRCNTVANDFEKYYNSFTEQGLDPVSIDPDEVPRHLREVAARTHNISWKQRVKFGPGGDAVLQPVSALGSIAHVPNEDINTPVVDWAKQQTGPGIPAESRQQDDVDQPETVTESKDDKETFTTDRTGAGGVTPNRHVAPSERPANNDTVGSETTETSRAAGPPPTDGSDAVGGGVDSDPSQQVEQDNGGPNGGAESPSGDTNNGSVGDATGESETDDSNLFGDTSHQ
ncbi:hypothetical protein ACFQDD_00585 [Halorubrum pallidum]|uniref:DUF8128 domain-containing protein n=1 Tax=Halorubrum pallidum TaxID=1526114 RepID=A0ABD5SYS9_9EURY